MLRFNLTTVSLLLGLAVITPTAHAALVIDYDVNIVETGPVTVGSTINWQIFATVSGTPVVGINNGIAVAAIDLQDSLGDTLSAGIIQDGTGEDFDGYTLSNNGSFVGGKLINIGTLQLNPDAMTVGKPGDLGPHLLATGSYTVTSVGLRTLSTVSSASTSSYWSDSAMPNATATAFDSVTFGSDTIMVTAAVPEPASLAMMGLAVCGAAGLRLRRRKNANRDRSQTA